MNTYNKLFLSLVAIGMVLIFRPLATTAASVVYNTTSYWPPVDATLAGFGPGQSSTVGETFVAPTGASVSLNDFSLYAESYYPYNGGIASLYLKAFVYEWSGSMTGQGGGAVGNPIYLGSSFLFSPPARPNGWVPLTVNFGGSGLTLNPGDHYVIGFTLSDPTDYAASLGDIEFQEVPNRNPNYAQLPVGIDGYGGAMWDNNSNNISAINTTIWDTWGDTGDYAFKADLTVAPEPTSAILLVFSGSVWMLRHFRAKNI